MYTHYIVYIYIYIYIYILYIYIYIYIYKQLKIVLLTYIVQGMNECVNDCIHCYVMCIQFQTWLFSFFSKIFNQMTDLYYTEYMIRIIITIRSLALILLMKTLLGLILLHGSF